MTIHSLITRPLVAAIVLAAGLASADETRFETVRFPGDEALYVSEMGGSEYEGQPWMEGPHTIAAFLNRNAALGVCYGAEG